MLFLLVVGGGVVGVVGVGGGAVVGFDMLFCMVLCFVCVLCVLLVFFVCVGVLVNSNIFERLVGKFLHRYIRKASCVMAYQHLTTC